MIKRTEKEDLISLGVRIKVIAMWVISQKTYTMARGIIDGLMVTSIKGLLS